LLKRRKEKHRIPISGKIQKPPKNILKKLPGPKAGQLLMPNSPQSWKTSR